MGGCRCWIPIEEEVAVVPVRRSTASHISAESGTVNPGLVVVVGAALLAAVIIGGAAVAVTSVMRVNAPAVSVERSATVVESTSVAPVAEKPVLRGKTLKERNPGLASPEVDAPAGSSGGKAATSSDDAIAQAYRNGTSGVEVVGAGVVERVLPDDSDGSAHQRFIVRLASGQTLLIAHNIDLAPRIVGLAAGDSVGFKGEYEWNSQGGVVHWTHRDPAGKHVAGWLKHGGRTYQ